jgi:hypothetical protein
VSTPDFTPPAIAAFVMLVITNLIVLLGVDITDTKKAAIAALVNAVVIVGFLVHDAWSTTRSSGTVARSVANGERPPRELNGATASRSGCS